MFGLKPKTNDKVRIDLLSLMHLPRKERRRIAKLNGIERIAGVQDKIAKPKIESQ